MKIKQHSNGYYYAHPVNSAPFSLRTKSRSEALKTIKETGLDKAEGARRLGLLTADAFQKLTSGKRVTIAQAADEFINHMPTSGYTDVTVRHMRTTLGMWMREVDIAGIPISSVEARHIDPWVNKKGSLKYSTRFRNLSDIRVFIDFCAARGLITHNPARNVDVKVEKLTQEQRLTTERLPFSDAEIEKILSSMSPGDFWHVATLVALDTGLRLKDVATLERASLKGNRLRVATSKASAGANPVVEHTLGERTLQSIEAIKSKDATYLFRPEALGMKHYQATEQSRLSQQFRRLCISLGIDGKSFHGMRHTFAMRRERERRISIFQEMARELALRGVQADLGHSSQATTKIYLSHNNKDDRQVR